MRKFSGNVRGRIKVGGFTAKFLIGRCDVMLWPLMYLCVCAERGHKTEHGSLIYKCNMRVLIIFRGDARVVMGWSAKPFTRVQFSLTSPKIVVDKYVKV